MKILDPISSTGWVTVVIEGRWVQAKIYDTPSKWGIDNGRISKCYIGKTESIDPNKPFLDQLDFSYDRALDFDNLPESLKRKIISKLDSMGV